MNIMDFANDDDFGSSWSSNHTVKQPWYELNFEKAVPCNMIVLTAGNNRKATYSLEYYVNGKWNTLEVKREGEKKVGIFRFGRIWCEKIKVSITDFDGPPAIAELGVFNERR
jgi:alpha-L-fucosidase